MCLTTIAVIKRYYISRTQGQIRVPAERTRVRLDHSAADYTIARGDYLETHVTACARESTAALSACRTKDLEKLRLNKHRRRKSTFHPSAFPGPSRARYIRAQMPAAPRCTQIRLRRRRVAHPPISNVDPKQNRVIHNFILEEGPVIFGAKYPLICLGNG